PAEAREFERRMRGDLPRNWQQTAAQTLETLLKQAAPQATRQSAQAVLNVLAPALPEVMGGSADLTGSNNTLFKGARTITPAQAAGDYLHYGAGAHPPAAAAAAAHAGAARGHPPRRLRSARLQRHA